MKIKDIIRAAQARAGYHGRTAEMCRITCFPTSTFSYKLKHGNFTLNEIKRLDRLLHFSDEECGQLIRGKKNGE